MAIELDGPCHYYNPASCDFGDADKLVPMRDLKSRKPSDTEAKILRLNTCDGGIFGRMLDFHTQPFR